MIYYSSNNKILDTDKYLKYDTGGNSTVYKNINSNVLFKVYRFDSKYRYHMGKNTFEMLKKLDIPNLVKLYDYYFLYKQKINAFLPMDAYTMELVDGKRIELIDMDKEYISQVLMQLDETLQKLTDKKILIGDSHKDNIIFNENGATLIDLDQFMKMNLFSKRSIYSFNKSGLMYSITTRILTEFNKKNPNKSFPFFYPKENTSFYDDCKFLLEETNVEESIKKYCYSRK